MLIRDILGEMMPNANIQKLQRSSSDDNDMSSDEQESIEDIPVARKCSENTPVSSSKLVSSNNPSNASSNSLESPMTSLRLSSTSDLEDIPDTEITPDVVKCQEISDHEDQDDMATKILPDNLKKGVPQGAASIFEDVLIKEENKDSETSPSTAMKQPEIRKIQILEVDTASDISLFVNRSRTSSQSSSKSVSSSINSGVYKHLTDVSTDYVRGSSQYNQEADCDQKISSEANFKEECKDEILEDVVATAVSGNLNNYAETGEVSYSYDLVNNAVNTDSAIDQQNTVKQLISSAIWPFTEKELITSSSSSSKSVASTQSEEGPSVSSKENLNYNSEFEYVQKHKPGLEHGNAISEPGIDEIMTKNASSNNNNDGDTNADGIANEMQSKENVSGLETKHQNGMIVQKGNEFYKYMLLSSITMIKLYL